MVSGRAQLRRPTAAVRVKTKAQVEFLIVGLLLEFLQENVGKSLSAYSSEHPDRR